MVGTGNWKKFINKRPWWAEGAGTMGQGISKTLSSTLYGDKIKALQNLPPGERVFIAHAPDTLKAYQKLLAEGFDPIRSKKTNLANLRALEEAVTTGTNPMTAKGGYTAVAKTLKEAYEAAEQFGKPWYSRGQSLFGTPHSNVLVGNIPRGTHPITKSIGNVNQLQASSDVLNKAFNIGDRGITKGVIPTKSVTHGLLSRLTPGLNIAAGGASALGHLAKGNYGQMAMAGLSMAPGALGWAGLGGELALGAMQDNPIPDYSGVVGKSGMQIGRNYNRGGIVNLLYGGMVDG